VGRLCLSAGDLVAARHHLAVAVVNSPGDLWANFYAGQCAYRQLRHADAVAAFSACVGSAPRLAGPYANRALAYAALGADDAALADYTRALELDGGLGVAWLNRGVLHHKAGRHDAALADLADALTHGADPALVHYNVAQVHRSRGDRAAALAAVTAALRHRPDYPQARALEKALRSAGRR
jgi:tetratricopeptide (TPR) repeat protein